MKRPLLRSSAFVRAAQKVVKKYPQNAVEFQSALELPLLGLQAQGMTCESVFRFVPYGGSEAILLESVGTHDEVY